MPHLVQMDKRYKNKGLTIIADEVQGSSDEDIEKMAKDLRMDFPITKGTTRPAGMRGIPHAVVFDATGALVFAGHPADDEFERTVKKALRDVDVDSDGEDDGDSRLPAGPKTLIETRRWTNEAGKSMTASVLAITEKEVTFLLTNGKTVDYPIEQLSKEDQDLLKETSEKGLDE